MQVGVSVIEADPLHRLGLVAALQEDPRLVVYAVGSDPRSALTGRERQPAVVLVGAGAYGSRAKSLAELLGEIRSLYPRGPVVVLSSVSVQDVRESASQAARDPQVLFLDAYTPPGHIARTVLRAALLLGDRAESDEDEDDERAADPWPAWGASGYRRTPVPGVERLTPREWDVVRLLGHRWEPREIAEDLGIAYSTVRSHLRSIYAKFGVTSRREAVREAVRLVRQWEAKGWAPVPRKSNGKG